MESVFEGLRLDRLTSTQKLILVALRTSPKGLFKADLRSMLKVTPEAITRSIAYLVQKQFVTRELRGQECFYRLEEPKP